MIVIETKFSDIVLKESNPKIEIYFEVISSLYNPNIDDRIAFEIRNQPRIRIKYDDPLDVENVMLI